MHKMNIRFRISAELNYFSELLLIAAAFLIGFRSTIGVSNFPNSIFFRLMSGLAWLFVYASLFLSSYTKRDLLISGLLLLLPFAIIVHSKVAAPFLNTVVIIAARRKDLKKVLEANFWGILSASVLTMMACFAGIIPDTVFLDGAKSLGFFNPNAFPIRFAAMVFLLLIIWYKKIGIFHLVLINIFSYFVYAETGSRAGIIIVFGFTLAVWLAKISKIVRSSIRKLVVVGAVVIAIFSIFGVFLYPVIPFFKQADKILTGRLSQPLYYFALYQPMPFGNYIKEFQIEGARPKNYTIDNGYIRILIEWGFLYLIFFLFGYWKTIKKYAKRNDCIVALALMFVLLYMLSESVFCTLNANWIIVLCSEVFFGRKVVKK